MNIESECFNSIELQFTWWMKITKDVNNGKTIIIEHRKLCAKLDKWIK